MDLAERITVNGWDFELVENDINDVFYQCHGFSRKNYSKWMGFRTSGK